LDLSTLEERNSLGARASSRTQPPKKNLNLKLFGTCRLGGMIETRIKQLYSNLKQQNRFRI
jgi:hypothetical protein